jgi:putative PIG3 family NAD(P)H quinone oxidoreductase
MRAVTIVDGSLDWREHDDPRPSGGEVVVRVRAAGLNGADMLQVAGLYPAPAGAPADIPGLELAGEVVESGPSATRFSPGDRIMAVVAGGGQAERAVVHERHLIPVPGEMDWEAAGGCPEVFTTAYDALFAQCDLTVGERVCVHGAAGGVGTAGVQLAVAAGATVVATVRDPDRRAQVAELGAEVVAPESFADAGPFDVVLELVGGPNLSDDVRALAKGGRIAVIGVGAGARAEISLLDLMAARGRIHGSTLRTRSLEEKAMLARRIEAHVLPLLASGAVRVPIAAVYPMDRAVDAYERFRAGGKFGKVVLTAP